VNCGSKPFPDRITFGTGCFPYNHLLGVEESYWIGVQSSRKALAAALAELRTTMATKKQKPKSKVRATARTAASHSRAKRAVTKHAAGTPALQYIPWHTIPLENLNPLLQRQFVVGQEIMLARVLLKKGCIVPEHSHHNEQLTYIVEGALKFWIDGKEIVVHAGEVLCIPSDMPHKAEAMEDTVDLDVFAPPRADWINKTDQYLRGKK
jgi:quercetin dioxygenase-like cupin family protein